MPKTSKKQREYQRNYYDKNKEREKRYQKRWREKYSDYLSNWRQRNKQWVHLTRRLRYECRPDKVRKRSYERCWPGLDASDLEFCDEIAEECDRVYQSALRRARVLFGRDPITGHKLDKEETED